MYLIPFTQRASHAVLKPFIYTNPVKVVEALQQPHIVFLAKVFHAN
jgi:hypothetical protein